MNTYENLTVTTDILNLLTVKFLIFFVVKVLIYRKNGGNRFSPAESFLLSVFIECYQ